MNEEKDTTRVPFDLRSYPSSVHPVVRKAILLPGGPLTTLLIGGILAVVAFGVDSSVNPRHLLMAAEGSHIPFVIDRCVWYGALLQGATLYGVAMFFRGLSAYTVKSQGLLGFITFLAFIALLLCALILVLSFLTFLMDLTALL